ncbi:hypothetical protein ACJJH9_06875 [Microbulbifer sp. DLAB2-AF]|uniref:hypothetical protein n=1 Tax=Microbulbifer sp. DLAB2-AF TaxID=3243395 RepID=UPI00403963B5
MLSGVALTKPARGTKKPPLRSGFSAPAGGVMPTKENNMQLDMTLDEAQKRAIESGLLSDEEIESLNNSLVEMRKLAEKDRLSYREEKEMERLRYIFDDLAVKGMPEFEHLRPKPQSLFTKILPFVVGILFVAVYFWWEVTNA